MVPSSSSVIGPPPPGGQCNEQMFDSQAAITSREADRLHNHWIKRGGV
jgi:hypothetical protein